MKAISNFLLFFGLLLLSGSAFAETELLVTPLSLTGTRMEALLKNPLVLKSESVFDPSEIRALKDLGAQDLSGAYRIVVRGEDEAKRLIQWAKDQGLKIEIKKNGSVMTLSEPLEKYQWGVRNSGRTHRLRLDDLTTIELKGKVGEDLGLEGAPAESQDPQKKVIVAVLDTGVDLTHPDLADQILTKKGECDAQAALKNCYLVEVESCKKITDPTARNNCNTKENKPACDAKWASVDTDGNGYPMDCRGWNLTGPQNPLTQIRGNEDVTDDRGHGTHVAGIIAAKSNGLGLKGVAQNVAILPVKIFRDRISSPVTPQSESAERRVTEEDPLPLPKETGAQIQGFVDIVARGMLYALRSGAQVINLSMAWPAAAETQLMRRMVQLAQSRGVVIVAAAGNDSTEARVFPCSNPGVVCVASHGPDGALSHFSNYGSQVEIAAPGLNVLSTWPMSLRTYYFTEREGYDYDNGTSMSAPFVAGAVARLIGAGVSGREAIARLYASARPVSASSLQSPLTEPKFIQFGNVDLAAAFKAEPRPLLVSASKWPIQIQWDGVSQEVALRVPVKNLWTAGSGIQLRAQAFGSKDFRVKTLSSSFETWNEGETKMLEVALLIDNPRLDQSIDIEFQVVQGDRSLGRFVVAAELVILVEPTSSGLGIEKIAIEGEPLPKGVLLRSVNEMDLSSARDYLAIEPGPESWRIRLIRELRDAGDTKYKVGPAVSLAAIKGEILSIQRLDTEFSGKSGYVILSQADAVGRKSFRLDYLDSDLNKIRTIEYDNKVSQMSDQFQWMKIREKEREHLAPAWIGIGPVPPLEKPAYDPWDPTPKEDRDGRLYYLASDGLRSVAAPTDQNYIQMLIQSRDQRQRGVIPVLVGTGKDFKLNYSMADVELAKVGELRPFVLPFYRMLYGLDNRLPLVSLNPNVVSSGVALSNPGVQGTTRTTWLLDSSRPETALDTVERSASITDSVYRLAAVFDQGEFSGSFTQTHYELQFHDRIKGTLYVTSAHRFSFLPGAMISRISFFPVVVGQLAGGEFLPGLMTPEGLGFSQGLEVVVPVQADSDRPQHLVRPARLHFSAGEGCDELSVPIPASENKPTRQSYFCGTHFLRIPLEF